LVDTGAWAIDLGLDALVESQGGAGRRGAARGSTAGARPGAGRGAASDVESLSSMLEPDRTGVHEQGGNGKLIFAIVALVLIVGGALGFLLSQGI
jgi:hypothetical protein